MPPAGPEEPEPAKTAFLVGLAEPLRGALGELLTVRRRCALPAPPSPALERWPPAPRCCRPAAAGHAGEAPTPRPGRRGGPGRRGPRAAPAVRRTAAPAPPRPALRGGPRGGLPCGRGAGMLLLREGGGRGGAGRATGRAGAPPAALRTGPRPWRGWSRPPQTILCGARGGTAFPSARGPPSLLVEGGQRRQGEDAPGGVTRWLTP